jgi:hypothetical protein
MLAWSLGILAKCAVVSGSCNDKFSIAKYIFPRIETTEAGEFFMVRYLLVGNGDDDGITGKSANADVIIQFNRCRYMKVLDNAKTSYIFVVNTGGELSEILSSLPATARPLMLSRNPMFYNIKKTIMKTTGRYGWHYFTVDSAPDGLETVSFIETAMLEWKLLRLGMRPGSTPSTGAIAYYWITRRMRAGDRVDIAGFTFTGWDRHPWEIERQFVKPRSL